jgi:polyisoprenoid-binding protein YceI
MKIRFAIVAAPILSIWMAGAATAAPVKYTIDPEHTYPSFEADHFGGLSTWRGKFTRTSGTIVYDKEAGSGTLDITIDPASVDTGHDKLNDHVRTGPDMLDVKKYPTATYTGKLAKFVNGAPTEVDGTLTLHGVSKPVTLKIDRFDCRAHPMKKGQNVCGANATSTIDRGAFGVDWGKNYGFKMDVKLEIQVEALTAAQ